MKIGKFRLFDKFVITSRDASDPYLIRWRLFECPWFGIFLHRILRSDDDEHFHDHPWNFVSIVLSGGYNELTPHGCNQRRVLSVAVRKATDMHKVLLTNGPATTLLLIGRRHREWGFRTEGGWVLWKDYLSRTNF